MRAPKRFTLAPPEPAQTSYWLAQADREKRSGSLEKATEFYRYALFADRQSLEAATGLADALRKQEQLTDAHKLYRWAYRKDKTYDAARIGLAWTLFQDEQIPAAGKLVHLSARLFDEVHLLGALALYRGDFSTSDGFLRKARLLAKTQGKQVDRYEIADLDCRLSGNRSTQQHCPFGLVGAIVTTNELD